MTKGIRTRLLLAFFWISSFALLAAAAALYAFLEVGEALERVTTRRVPDALASLEVSRQAERIVAAAPKLLNVADDAQHAALSAAIQQQVEHLRVAANVLVEAGIDAPSAHTIQHNVGLIGTNLLELDDVVAAKLAAATHMRARLIELSKTYISLQRDLQPQVTLLEARGVRLRRLQSEDDATQRELAALAADIGPRLPMQRVLLETGHVNDTLLQAAAEAQPEALRILEFPLARALDNLDTAVRELPPEMRAGLQAQLAELESFVRGDQSIPALRERELAIRTEGEQLLRVNNVLSQDLTRAMDALVAAAKADIGAAGNDALAVQRYSTNIMVTVVVLTLVSSVLIVLLYVDRSLLMRLRLVSDSLRGIASGDLSTPVPAAGDDEIGQMAAALEVFRNTAIEVEQSNLREIESARSRLTDAIESISDGFALFDVEDRLVLANDRYMRMVGLEDSPGEVTFESIMRNTLAQGRLLDIGPDPEQWCQRRLTQHRNPGGANVLRFADGRWVRVNERRTEGGNTVGVYSDITELKQRELELAQAISAKDSTLAELTIVLDAIDYGVLFMDADLRIRVCNRKYREIWKMPESFFARQPTLRDDIEFTRANGLYVMAEGSWEDYVEQRIAEVRAGNVSRELTLADGSVLQHQCVALPDGGRMLTYFDITMLKRRERELAEAVRQKDVVLGEFQAVLDNIDYGIVFADADLRVRLANQAMRRMWQIPGEILDAQPTIQDLFRFHRGRRVHAVPDRDWDTYVERRIVAIRNGHVPRSELRTTDGRTLLYECIALPDGVRMLTYFDVTPLKRIEEALRESEERYSLAMEGANEGLWEWKASNDEIYVSPRFVEMTSLPPGRRRITLRELQELLHPADYPIHYQALIAHLRGEVDFYDAEYRLRGRDGEYHWIQNRGIGLRDENGRVYRMAGSVSNIDIRKQAELALRDAKDKAEQASRVKSQFLANMSHELRTPLNAVIGITEMLREDVAEQGHTEFTEPLERVSRAGKHLLNLINDILDISKIEAGRLELFLEHSDLAGLLQDAISTAQPLAQQNDNQLELELNGNLGVAFVDPVRLRQVMLNLLGNACKFTRAGRVTLRARRRRDGAGDHIELAVADTGIGIEPQHLDSLFDEFTQVDSSATRRYGGTGLGLAICRRLVHLMGGKIGVHSTPGEGTTFTVELPAVSAAPAPAAQSVSALE